MSEDEFIEKLKKRLSGIVKNMSGKDREQVYAKMIANITDLAGPSILGSDESLTPRETRLLAICINQLIALKALTTLVDTIEPQSEEKHQARMITAAAEFAHLSGLTVDQLLQENPHVKASKPRRH